MGIKFYDSNGKYWGEYDETRSLFIPSEETITQTETQNSNSEFEKRTMRDCYNCKRYESEEECVECKYEPKQTKPMTDCLTCRYNSDEWDSPKCDGCTKAHSNYEPQRGYMWTCPKCGTENHSDFTKCPCCGEPKDEPQTDCAWK